MLASGRESVGRPWVSYAFSDMYRAWGNCPRSVICEDDGGRRTASQ